MSWHWNRWISPSQAAHMLHEQTAQSAAIWRLHCYRRLHCFQSKRMHAAQMCYHLLEIRALNCNAYAIRWHARKLLLLLWDQSTKQGVKYTPADLIHMEGQSVMRWWGWRCLAVTPARRQTGAQWPGAQTLFKARQFQISVLHGINRKACMQSEVLTFASATVDITAWTDGSAA